MSNLKSRLPDAPGDSRCGSDADLAHQDSAAIIAARERHAAGWKAAFTKMLQLGYVTGRLIENPHCISVKDMQESVVPGVTIQIDKFVVHHDGRTIFDYPALGVATACAVRMADNLVDIFGSINKSAGAARHISVSVVGTHKALSELGLGRSEKEAWKTSSRILSAVKLNAYRASVSLAAEKGAYPAFDKDAVLARPEVRLLPAEVRQDIAHFGLRNDSLFRQPLTLDEK